MILITELLNSYSLLGSLSKKKYKINGIPHIVKGNSSGNREAFSEALGSRIAALLTNYQVINYSMYESSLFKEVMDGGFSYVSASKIFKEPLVNYQEFVKDLVNLGKVKFSSNNLLDTCSELSLDIDQLYSMFIADAVIGNKDRHVNNFDVYEGNGIMKLAPMLDFGQSMLFDVHEYDLDFIDYLSYNEARPLFDNHTDQIEYLKSKLGVRKLIKVSYDEFEDFIFNKNDDIFNNITSRREKTIKRYLLGRYKFFAEQFEV